VRQLTLSDLVKLVAKVQPASITLFQNMKAKKTWRNAVENVQKACSELDKGNNGVAANYLTEAADALKKIEGSEAGDRPPS
jgi:hypothetical protein